MKSIAIIPARSGSKGLIDKNIKLLNGKPLLAYTIESAKKTNLFSEIMVSTDSEKYSEIAKTYGASVPFLRDYKTSDDLASSWDVVKEVIFKYKELGFEFETIALLQPTSPLRTSSDIIKGFDIFKNNNANSVISVCETEHSPLWSNTLPKNLSMSNFINPEILNTPRQRLPSYYQINGAIYIVKTNYIISSDDIYRDRSFALIMKKENSIDIDNYIDFFVAESILKLKSSNKNIT